MSDSTNPLDQVSQSATARETTTNSLFDAHSPSSIYGRHASTCSGLTWGYYGGRWGGFSIANGTQLLADATTTYMVVAKASGVVSFSTVITNWNDATNYARAYLLVTASGVVTYSDYRAGSGGTVGAGGAGGTGTVTTVSVVTANGVSGSVATATTTPAIMLALGAITPTTVNGNTITTGTATLTGATGKTLTWSNSLTLAGTDGQTMTFPPASASIGYLNIPQNSQSAAYTTVMADGGKHLLHPAADTNARTFTIDSNANVAYPLGTAITFINETSQVVSIAITSDTLTLAGTTTTGTRSLAQNGIATAVKVTTTKWIISGTGLT